MENKGTRSASGSQDSKLLKTSDSISTGGKSQNKNGRKRENYTTASWNVGVGNNLSGPNLPATKNSKSWQGKQKGSDRRQQKTKVGFGGSGTNRKTDSEVSCADPDVELLVNQNAKKQDLAHLLNMKFQFAPRPTRASQYTGANCSEAMHGNKRRSNHTHTRGYLNKDHYLQANCQFVVKGDGDYSPYLSDPDLMVPWESIEQIRIWGSEVGSCPICLHQPVAAKMTRCGHIYCWPCILHFLALSDKPSRPCPICDSPIRVGDLRSVIALEQRAFVVGDVIELKLMKRERFSLQPQPVRRINVNHAAQPYMIHYLNPGEDHVFNKLLACTPNDILKFTLPEERRELEAQFEAEKDCPEACFIQQALELLSERECAMQDLLVDTSALTKDLDTLTVGDCGGISDIGKAKAVECQGPILTDFEKVCDETASSELNDHSIHVSQDDSQLGISEGTDRSTEYLEGAAALPVQNSGRPLQHKTVFYFYQSSDGQAVFLHPINVQMLVRYYGSLEMGPETVQGRIVEIESLSMSEELRNRMRYLGHVPLSKHFQIVELAFDHSIVPRIILAEFQDRVDEREKRRQRRDREEQRRDLEIQRAEEAKWGRSQRQPIMQMDSHVHFPDFSPSSFEASPFSAAESEHSIPVDDELCQTSANGKSFAQMLRQGKQTITWPSLGNPQPKPALTTMRTSQSTPSFVTKQDSDEDNEDYAPPPDYKQTFSSALAAALDQAASRKGNLSAVQKSKPEGQSGKKGKKPKQKVLFSTGMNFI